MDYGDLMINFLYFKYRNREQTNTCYATYVTPLLHYFYPNQVTLEQRTYQNREVLETYLQGCRTDIIANLYIFFFEIYHDSKNFSCVCVMDCIARTIIFTVDLIK